MLKIFLHECIDIGNVVVTIFILFYFLMCTGIYYIYVYNIDFSFYFLFILFRVINFHDTYITYANFLFLFDILLLFHNWKKKEILLF